MAKTLTKLPGFIEKSGTSYGGSTPDEAIISEILAGRAKWEGEDVAAQPATPPPAAQPAAAGGTSPAVAGLQAAAPSAATSSSGSGGGMTEPDMPPPIMSKGGRMSLRAGIGNRMPPSLEGLLQVRTY
jgi:hypothetical protein